MAAPVCTDIGDCFEAMRDTVFNLVFVALLYEGQSRFGGKNRDGRTVSVVDFEIHLVSTFS